jgi:hypothetical protein
MFLYMLLLLAIGIFGNILAAWVIEWLELIF